MLLDRLTDNIFCVMLRIRVFFIRVHAKEGSVLQTGAYTKKNMEKPDKPKISEALGHSPLRRDVEFTFTYP